MAEWLRRFTPYPPRNGCLNVRSSKNALISTIKEAVSCTHEFLSGGIEMPNAVIRSTADRFGGACYA